jgi:hypothetical protein
MTPDGQQAMAIARWAWADPSGRVGEAISKVRALASSATGQALAEIQDAGTMLSRLAGTLDTGPVVAEGTIIGQLAGDTLTGQLVDLSEAWRHERRGPGGKWIGPGGAVKAAERTAKGNARLRRIQAAQARHASSAAPSTGALSSDEDDRMRQLIREELDKRMRVPADLPPENKAAEVAFQVSGKAQPTRREQLIHQQLIASQVAPLAESKAKEAVAQAQRLVDQKIAQVKAQENTHEGRKAKMKLATEAGISVTGGALSYLAIKAGAPEVVPILATVGTFLIQTIIEFFKRL